MVRTAALGALALLILGAATEVRAEDPPVEARPSDNDIFANPQVEKPAEVEKPAASGKTTDAARDDLMLGANGSAAMPSGEIAPEDPLRMGGSLYLRSTSTAKQGQSPDDWAFSSPSLLDTYLDARPNERVRAFVLGRMSFDPTLPTASAPATGVGPLQPTGSTQGSQSLSSLFGGRTRGPQVVLDQLWLRFDIAHRAFVTAGKQHVRWGVARMWTPTDYLHFRHRNPLDVFDARTGTTMVKLHLPVETLGWNFYGYGVIEDDRATPTVGDIAGAGRAEIVLGPAELGLGAMLKRGRKPRWAIDLSTGIGEIDFYGELALRYGSEIDRVGYDANATLPPLPMDTADFTSATLQYQQSVVDAFWPAYRSNGIKPQAVGGLTWQKKYNDNDVLTIGAEYFYNGLGYNSVRAYPGLVFPHGRALADPATFFYLGRHYAAVFATLPAPFSLDLHTFTLSNLANLSDQSFITRLDYSYTLLTHLRLDLFVSAHYGRTEGEFRFGVSSLALGGKAFSIPPSLLDLGVALRVGF